MSFLLIYVTHPSKPEAVRMTAELLNAHLIACANYFPIESTYWWDGRLTHADEIVTLYKTTHENADAVRAMIESSHKYDIPCIMRLSMVEANGPYENWIQAECIKNNP